MKNTIAGDFDNIEPDRHFRRIFAQVAAGRADQALLLLKIYGQYAVVFSSA